MAVKSAMLKRKTPDGGHYVDHYVLTLEVPPGMKTPALLVYVGKDVLLLSDAKAARAFAEHALKLAKELERVLICWRTTEEQ